MGLFLLIFSGVCDFLLPGRLHEVVLRVALLVQNHLRAERLLLLGRELEVLLEECDGDSGGEVLTHACGNVLVARLDHLARVDVVPRGLRTEEVAKSPHLEIHLLLGIALLVRQVAHGHVQVRALAGSQAHTIALGFGAHRAPRASMGAPDGVALAAGDERVVDSLVGLGLFRRHDGNGVVDVDLDGFGGGLDVLDGLHCLCRRLLGYLCLVSL